MMREQAVGNTWRAYMRGRIGVILLNRAPNNALSSEFAAQLQALMTLMIENDAVEGIVFASDLPHFLSGSDVADLTAPKRGDKANLVQLCDVIAQSPKPIVAAIHGACISAGLDLALAATARVGQVGAEFAYTDIKLGLMPAAGGAFRLPALIGAAPALEMLLHGQPVSAEAALKLNLIDHMVGQDVVGAAVRLAQKIVDGRIQLHRRDPVKDARAFQAAVAAARNQYAGQHLQAYRKIIDCVEAGQFFAPEQAQILQNTLFEELRQGQQAQGLCYAFVANHKLRAQGRWSYPPQAQAGLEKLGLQPPDAAQNAAVEAAIKECLSRCMAEMLRIGLTRETVIAALSSYGIGVPTGAVLPAPPPDAHEILTAIRAALANCGALLLRKGAVQRASDFDAIAVQSGLFPRWQGGPLYHADKRGPLVMRADLRRRAVAAPDLFTPDPLFDTVIADGLRFADYAAH